MASSEVTLCGCGCRQPAPIASYTHKGRGWIAGQPKRFIHGHNGRGVKRGPRVDRGDRNVNWKGGRRVLTTGYIAVRVTPGHQGVYRHEHILVAERALGRPLPPFAIVHHVDGSRTNNANSNLAVLQSRQEHIELHRRLRVLRAGGNPWSDRICSVCREAKPNEFFYQTRHPRRGLIYGTRCMECSRTRQRGQR